jgi:hypothetical protein
VKIIEKKFYQQALAKAMLEEINETAEDREKMQQCVARIQERAAKDRPEPDLEKIKWFEQLQDAVIEFSQNCHLDMSMSLNGKFIGTIVFETSYLELSLLDDPIVRKFWVYLCQHGQLTIAQKAEVFSMEFQFDLRRR